MPSDKRDLEVLVEAIEHYLECPEQESLTMSKRERLQELHFRYQRELIHVDEPQLTEKELEIRELENAGQQRLIDLDKA